MERKKLKRNSKFGSIGPNDLQSGMTHPDWASKWDFAFEEISWGIGNWQAKKTEGKPRVVNSPQKCTVQFGKELKGSFSGRDRL